MNHHSGTYDMNPNFASSRADLIRINSDENVDCSDVSIKFVKNNLKKKIKIVCDELQQRFN